MKIYNKKNPLKRRDAASRVLPSAALSRNDAKKKNNSITFPPLYGELLPSAPMVGHGHGGPIGFYWPTNPRQGGTSQHPQSAHKKRNVAAAAVAAAAVAVWIRRKE